MNAFGPSGPSGAEISPSPAASLWARVCALWGGVNVTRRKRSLRLCESLSLGEKRLLALVECEGQRLLLSVTSERIALIERLGEGSQGSRESSSPLGTPIADEDLERDTAQLQELS